MAKKKKEFKVTRSEYFFKTLYQNPASTMEIKFEKKIFVKDEELHEIEVKSMKVNYVLILLLILMFIITSRVQSVWVVLAYLFIVVVGQVYRYSMYPKNIMDHIKDTGFTA